MARTMKWRPGMKRSLWGSCQVLVQGVIAALVLVLAGRLAHATDPARVHVILHTRGDAGIPVTFVDISVIGTSAPIRLIRRIEGTCSLENADDPRAALVRVNCASATPVRFEVARDRDEIVVRRAADATPDAGSTTEVIARAVVARGADVRVE